MSPCEPPADILQSFNKPTMSGVDSPFIRAKCEVPSRIVLEAGTVQGVTVGSRMTVYASEGRYPGNY